MFIVVGHALEHILQTTQVFALGWPRPEAGGLLGFWLPELVTSEALHFTYNFMQLLGLVLLRQGFSGRAKKAWTAAMLFQSWHFFEHFLLQMQWLTGHFLFEKARQTSIGELLLPRVELHFIYVSVVTMFTVLALIWHFRTLAKDGIRGDLLFSGSGRQAKTQASKNETS